MERCDSRGGRTDCRPFGGKHVPALSVHVAKAGGTSLATALAAAYGEAFHRQHDDGPMNPVARCNLDPAVAGRIEPPAGKLCIHGHYHPGRHALAPGDYLFTLLRPPVENLISLYFYWKQAPRQGNPLHDYVLDTGLDILAMARLPLIRTVYSRSYFGGFPMDRFDQIADHRNRVAAITRLSAAVGRPLDAHIRVNETPPDPDRAAIEADPRLLARLRDILIDDIRFFKRYAEGR